MNLRTFLTLAVALTVLAVTTGCERALVLKTPLEPDEKISKDDAVLVDGKAAGRVKAVVTESGQRIAVLAITDESLAKAKMRAGVLRVREAGSISLRTDTVDTQSAPLASGAVIPVTSKTGFALRQFASSRILTSVLIGLAVLAVALLLFRRLARGWLLLLTLALSAGIAWAALPWTSEAVAKLYALRPPALSRAPTQASGAGQTLSNLIRNPPDPRTVGYAAAFVIAFVTISVALRRSLNHLDSRT